MLKKIFSISILLLFISCSKDQANDDSESNFNIVLSPSKTTVGIDEEFNIVVTSTEVIKSMWVSLDNFATGGYSIRDFGNSYTLNFNFDSLGEKIIYIKCQNQDNIVSQKVVTINVVRGNSIKINQLQIISFNNINQTWDPEFSITDENRLADLKFAFLKPKLNNFYEEGYAFRTFHLSNVISNQGAMTWDLSSSNLYLDPNLPLRFGLVDVDGEFLIQDLLNGPPDYKTITFTDYLTSKPSTITYSFPEVNLEFKLFLEWSQ